MSNLPEISGKFILAAINWDGKPDLESDVFAPETYQIVDSIDDLTENLNDIFEDVVSRGDSIPTYVGLYKLVEVAEVRSEFTLTSVYNEANSKTTEVESKPDQLVTGQTENQSSLTPRENEALNLRASGFDVNEIARRMNITPKTVLNYLDRIRKKQQQASINQDLSALTPRERQLYDWLKSGKSVESFARMVQIQISTAKALSNKLRAKIGLLP